MKKSKEATYIEEATEFMSDEKSRKMLLRFNVTDEILTIMEEKSITKSMLARKMKMSPAHISQILSGHRNFTLDTLTSISMALEHRVEINFKEEKSIDSFHKESKALL